MQVRGRIGLLAGVALLLLVTWLVFLFPFDTPRPQGTPVPDTPAMGTDTPRAADASALEVPTLAARGAVRAPQDTQADGGGEPGAPPVRDGHACLFGYRRSDQGEVVAGGRVVVHLERGMERTSARVIGSEDPSGWYAYFVPLDAPATLVLRVEKKGWGPAGGRVEAVPGGRYRLDLVFDRGLSIEGRVVDVQGRPCPGVLVHAFPRDPPPPDPARSQDPDVVEALRQVRLAAASARTTPEGRFRLTGLRDLAYRLEVPRGGVAGVVNGRATPLSGFGLGYEVLGRSVFHPSRESVTLRVQPVLRVGVSVIDQRTGRGVTRGQVRGELFLGAEVGRRRLEATRATAIEAGHAVLAFEVPVGTLRSACAVDLHVAVPDYEPHPVVHWEGAAGQIRAHEALVRMVPEVIPPQGSAWLHLVDAHGDPVDVAVRFAERSAGADPNQFLLPTTVRWKAAKRVGAGRVRLRGDVGRVRIRLQPKQHRAPGLEWEGEVTFRPGDEPVWQDCELPPLAILEIRLPDGHVGKTAILQALGDGDAAGDGGPPPPTTHQRLRPGVTPFVVRPGRLRLTGRKGEPLEITLAPFERRRIDWE